MTHDPGRFNPSYNPAIVHLLEGKELFVAHQRTTEQGWLWCILWDGTRRKIPPQQIEYADTVETTKLRDGERRWQEIDDGKLRSLANQAVKVDSDRQRAVADGGETPHPHAGRDAQ